MKRIKINRKACTGCRHCEAACSLKHNENEVNPKRSRIRVYLNEEDDIFFPIIAGSLSEAESSSKFDVFRPWFREPVTDSPLRCDFCGTPPDPHCVKVCASGALTVVEA